uniref:Solute carrier family 66 member 1 n=1 Tax=Ovis aries TaxID=9940 RepID=A0AC11ENV2_SHEEP
MNSLNPHECMGWREALSSPHPADEETEARRGRAACPKLRCPQAERGLPRTCLTAEPVYGHFDLYPDCVLGFRGSIRARQEAWGGLRVAGPQRGLDLLRLKVPLFCRAVSCLSTRLPPSLHSHGLSEAGPRQLLQLPQRLQPVDMGRARRVRPGRLGQGQRGLGLALHPLLCGIHLPYIKACKTGNMDQALSVWFLLGWIGGDSCNLIGSFLADQLPLQTYTAVYYVLADVLMLSLYFYYKFKKRPSPWSARINSLLLFILGVACTTPLLRSARSGAAPREVFRGRTLLSVEPGNKPFTEKEVIGFAIGSVSSVLYLFSRLPQIRTNFLRKSTQGISYSLFALVMLGNTLYGLSVLLKNPEEGQSEGSYVLHHLPWLVGSLGVLLLDTIISVQFFLYRHAAPSSERQPLLPS